MGGYYARIAQTLIEEKRWDELDFYFTDMADMLSTDREPVENWSSLADALIKAGEFDRYLKFIDMLNDGTEESWRRQKSIFQSRETIRKKGTEDTRKQIWFMQRLLISSLDKNDVPKSVLEIIWPRFIRNCREYDYVIPRGGGGGATNLKPNAAELMGACLVGILERSLMNKYETEILQDYSPN